ncbi:MAG: SDR family oxidoreductase [Betaproteobacteria bacterium]|nr:SDR family oxidoreductase [Betaproteobacteria bacterium]
MKLLVLGATGATGRQIVAQALERAHEVVAFVRNPGKLAISNDRLRVVTGSIPDDTRALTEAVRGQDAVVSALGVGNLLKSSDLISRSMRAIVPAMESQEVRRLLFVSAFGVGETRRDVPLLPRIAQRLLLADVFADKEAGEDYLRRSSLDWTLIHPAILTNGPKTAKYRVGERLELHGLPKISRADVADFVLSQLEDATYLRKEVLISN